MSKIQYVLIALAAAVVILAAGSIYTVNQGEQALVCNSAVRSEL